MFSSLYHYLDRKKIHCRLLPWKNQALPVAMAITILSLKSEDTLFITLEDIAHGKKLQYLFIACQKSIIASFIDLFTQKTGPKGSRATAETAKRQEKLQGGESFLFSLHFLAIKRGGLYIPKYEPFLSQTSDRWYKRVTRPSISRVHRPAHLQFGLIGICSKDQRSSEDSHSRSRKTLISQIRKHRIR